MNKPSYFAILDADVRYDKRLKPMEKILYAEITSLLNMNGKCEAENIYFAGLYDVNKKTVSSWITNLHKLGYITVNIIKNDIGRVEKRVVSMTNSRVKPIDKKVNTPMHEKMDTYPQKSQGGIHKKMEVNKTNLTGSSNNLTDSYIPIVPKDIFYNEELFNEYLADRKNKKLSNSQSVVSRLVNKLKEYSEKGFNPDEIIIEALQKGWKDFYPPKVQPESQAFNESYQEQYGDESIFDVIKRNL